MKPSLWSFRPNWPAMIGLLLLLWGTSGVFETIRYADPTLADVPEDGFVPYLVSVDPFAQAPTLEHVTPVVPQPELDTQSTRNPTPASGIKPDASIDGSVKNDAEKPVDLTGIPDRIEISSISLDAPIIQAQYKIIRAGAQDFDQWLAPDKNAVGWHYLSAKLGEVGNLVLNGHHNTLGEVFRHLVDLNVGDSIRVYSGHYYIEYRVTNKLILPEKNVELPIRLGNARWILPSQDERLTLVTCWPYETNTHRLIIAASPVTGLVDVNKP